MSININVTNQIVQIDETSEVVQINASGGIGVPSGGLTNQILAKNSNTNYDFKWTDNVASVYWGQVSGTLSNQTDLQNALNLKVPYTGASGNVTLGTFGLTAGTLTLQPQALNSSTFSIGQTMATNDSWKIYGFGSVADEGDLFFELQDNAAFINGQRFRFYYGNASSGTPKDILLMDYNGAVFDGTLKVTGLAGVGSRMVVTDVNGALSTSALPQAALTLTTTGTSGAATLVGATLNIPQYSGLNIYNSDGTLTSARTLTSGGFPLTFTGSNTAASAIARGLNLTHTLVASANSDVLVGLDINPTFTNGAFTNVANIGLRVNNSYFVVSGDYFPPTILPAKGLVFEASGGAARISSRFASATASLNISSSALTISSGATITGSLQVGGTDNNFFQLCKVYYTVATGGIFASYGRNLSAANDMVLYANTGRSLFLSADNIRFTTANEATERMTLTAAGRLLLGTTTESTFLLDVNGTARVSGNLTLSNANPLSLTNAGAYFSIGSYFFGSSGSIIGTNNSFADWAVRIGSGGLLIANGTNNNHLLREGLALFTDNAANTNITGSASAVLQANSTTKGFLPPRMTTTEKNAISSPATGLQVYDTTLGSLNVYNGTSWIALGAGGGGGGMAIGGSITSATAGSVLFAGTSGVLQQDNANFFWDDTNNRLSIGSTTPTSQFYVKFPDNNVTTHAAFYANNLSIGVGITWEGIKSISGSNSFLKLTGSTGIYGVNLNANLNLLAQGGLLYAYGSSFCAGYNVDAVTDLYFNYYGYDAGTTQFRNAVFGNGKGTNILKLFGSTGNLVLQSGGTFTDAGYRLDVNGTARVRNFLVENTSTTTTAEISVSNNPTSGANAYFRQYGSSAAGTAFGLSLANGTLLFTNDSAYLLIGTLSSQNLIFGTAGSERGRFTSAGRLLLGTTSEGTHLLDVNGSARITLPAVGTSSYLVISSGTASAFNSYIGTTASNQYAWFTNIKYDGTAFVRDSASRSAWRLNQVVDTTDALSNLNIDYFNPSGVYSNYFTIYGGGNTVIGSSTNIESALLSVSSTTKGFLPPRMTTTQINAIASPAEGLIAYNTTISHLCCYQSGQWVKFNHSPM